MTLLSDNRQLYNYMLVLITKLNNAGAIKLANSVDFAVQQASSLCTEFLGESRIDLLEVFNQGKGILTLGEIEELKGILDQLDQALPSE